MTYEARPDRDLDDAIFAAERYGDDLVFEPESHLMRAEIAIMGKVHATYEDGKITRLVFAPDGSDAGYFGPAAILMEGEEDLDVEDTDGPFWRAVQTRLVENPSLEWSEDG